MNPFPSPQDSCDGGGEFMLNGARPSNCPAAFRLSPEATADRLALLPIADHFAGHNCSCRSSLYFRPHGRHQDGGHALELGQRVHVTESFGALLANQRASEHWWHLALARRGTQLVR